MAETASPEDARRERDAGDRRALFAELGIPLLDVFPLQRLEVWSERPFEVTARLSLLRDDGRLMVRSESVRPTSAIVGDGAQSGDWHRPYRLAIDEVHVPPSRTFKQSAGEAGERRWVVPPEFYQRSDTPGAVDWVKLTLRMTMRYGSSLVYAEHRMRADGSRLEGVAASLAVGQTYTPDDWERAEFGLSLLRDADTRWRLPGRPRGQGQRFAVTLEAVLEAYYQLQNAPTVTITRDTYQPSYEEVAHHLWLLRQIPISGESLERRVRKDWGRFWPPTTWPEWPRWEAWREGYPPTQAPPLFEVFDARRDGRPN